MNQSGDKGHPPLPKITLDELHQHVPEGDGMHATNTCTNISMCNMCLNSHNSL